MPRILDRLPSPEPAAQRGGGARLAIHEVVLTYALFASAWILFSDSLLAQLIRNPDQMMVASTVKGWVFVAVTSLLLFFLMRRMVPRLGERPTAAEPAAEDPRSRFATTVLIGITIASIAGASALLAYHQESRKDYARLQALAELKAGQVAAWTEERKADASFIHSSTHWATLFRRWRAGDMASGELLSARLEEYRSHHRYGAILLLDPEGRLALATNDWTEVVSPELRDAAIRAGAEHRIVFSSSATLERAHPLRLEFMAPLPGPPSEPSPVVVLVVDSAATLMPMLAEWPYPGEAPAIALVRRGDGEMRMLPARGAIAKAAIHGEFGAPGVRDVGSEVTAAARVQDTEWLVAASMERESLLAEARAHAFWIGLAGAFGLFATAALGFVFRQRQQLRFAHVQQREQSEKLQALTDKERLTRELERHRDHLEELVEERTRELERMVANLERFNYTISHDLRAPLRAINGFASVLSSQDGERLSPDGERLLERIRTGADHMDRLLSDILEYSRVDRAEPLRKPVDLKRLAEDVARELASDYPQASVVVGELPTVQADATMMRQVFGNLIGNALKFSAGKTAPCVEVGAGHDAGTAEIFVRDNGAGFDTRYAGKLFMIFQRLHSETEFPGTGVGLAIVKRLVEHHGGAIRAESTPGQGATFRFSIAPGA